MLEDRNGTTWFGTRADGVLKFENERIVFSAIGLRSLAKERGRIELTSPGVVDDAVLHAIHVIAPRQRGRFDGRQYLAPALRRYLGMHDGGQRGQAMSPAGTTRRFSNELR